MNSLQNSNESFLILKRRVRIQILSGLVLITLVACGGWIWRTVTIRSDIAHLLAKSIERDLQSGDLRGAMINLDRAGTELFHKVVYIEENNSVRFIVGKNSARLSPFSARVQVKSHDSDEEKSFLVFQYNPLDGLWLFLLAVLPILALAGHFEYIRSTRRIYSEIQSYGLMKSAMAKEKLASQVAHDIRSPLAALEMVMKEAATLPEEQRLLVRSATSRIRDIANELLNKNRAMDPAIPTEPASPQLLSAIIELIVTEKRMQYRGHAGIEIESQLGKDSFGLFATLPPNEFKRVISNLVNNSVEAMENGHVIIVIRRENDDVFVEIQDSGKGIPPEVFSKLGEQSISHGKKGLESGSGLGVLHARRSAESWGGRLEISSDVGKGSVFTIRLPRSDAPKWFLPEILLDAEAVPIVIDDDMSILRVWEGRFASVGIKNFVHFSSAENFEKWYADTEKKIYHRFFFDYELLGSSETGLDLIEKHDLSAKSILVTSRFEERKILDRVQQLEIKLLPKGLVAFVPIRQSDSKSIVRLDAILIDDDALIHQAWDFAAKKKNKFLLCFSSTAEFFEKLPDVTKDTCIYIDSDLAPEQLKGEEIAKALFERGYRNLFLCTGYPASRFPPLPWIKGIVGKEPPWL